MIIVNQDKTEFINLDKITEVTVNGSNICVTDKIEQTDGLIIATYSTEKRAKEVWQEIIEKYTNWENYKAGQIVGICSSKYELPEE